MDHIVHRVLQFDRFVLDLTRGCLLAGEQDIDLRPKPFEVLCYLAENAGCLVPKQELYEAVGQTLRSPMTRSCGVFGNCATSSATTTAAYQDDVSPRGYLLNATVGAGAAVPVGWTCGEIARRTANKLDNAGHAGQHCVDDLVPRHSDFDSLVESFG